MTGRGVFQCPYSYNNILIYRRKGGEIMCFDFDDFFDLEMEDFALLGGAIGYIEEEVEEKVRIEKEMEEDTPDPSDDDLIP
jgi:hypothetical protein